MIDNSFEYPAQFWIPGEKSNFLFGKLIYREGEFISFEIWGAFKALNYMRLEINTHKATSVSYKLLNVL